MRWEIFVRVSIILLLVSGVVLLFGNEVLFPAFYRTTLMGVMALLQATLLFAPSYLLSPATPERKRYVLNLQLSLAFVFAVNNAGTLGLYSFDENLQYDKIVHFINSFILLLAAAHFFSGWFNIPMRKAAAISFAAVVLGGFGWEFFEYGVDRLFDTILIGIRGHLKEFDTVLDIFFDIAGALTAVGVLALRMRNNKVGNGEITFTWR